MFDIKTGVVIYELMKQLSLIIVAQLSLIIVADLRY